MSLAFNLVALLLVVGLSWAGMMWLAGLVHHEKEPSEKIMINSRIQPLGECVWFHPNLYPQKGKNPTTEGRARSGTYFSTGRFSMKPKMHELHFFS